jgi:asparagine synthase (glutamine-hydrolysing)
MCGIAGHAGREPADEGRIEATLALMDRRGPDDRAFATGMIGDSHVSLLHSRLSIIDLDARANQPFTVGDVTIAFNGEIYNYVELRARLEREGRMFRTTSDTEVLVHSYLAWGRRCVESLEGMWAFALLDRRSGELVLSRDRFGEKPLYWTRTRDGIVFGSEVKLLRALSGERLRVNEAQLSRYLVNGYKSLYKTGDTFFEGVAEVPSGCTLVIGPELAPREERYWTPRCVPADMTMAEAVEGFRTRLHDSMRIRLRADVPLAFCLSGGVDSSALASIAAKTFGYDVHTFSIVDEDPRYNELGNIQATIDDLGCRHTIIDVPRTGTFERLRDLVAYHDAPVATISYLVHSYISEAIHDNGYRVAVSGTAADELVTGYYDHFNMHLAEMRRHSDFERYLADWQANTGRFVRNPHLKDPLLFVKAPAFREHIYLDADVYAGMLTRPFAEPFAEERFCDGLLRNRMMNELFREAIPVILHEDDLNSMRFSIENRSPYLDTALMEFAYSIPVEHLIHDGYGKYVLRQAVAGILNDTVRLDRQKKGFNASIHSIVDLADPETRAYLLADSPVFDIVKRDAIARLMDTEPPMTNSMSKFMFNFINTKLFLEIDGEG